MTITPRIQHAIEFMKAGHRAIGQKRKFSGLNYEVHPLGVAEIVSEVVDDEDLIIAGILHDLLEDVSPSFPALYSVATINDLYGFRVAGIVDDLTDRFTTGKFPELNRAKRKELEHKRLAVVDRASKLVKLADVIHNGTDFLTVEDGFARKYFEEIESLVPVLYVADSEPHAKLYIRAMDVLTTLRAKLV